MPDPSTDFFTRDNQEIVAYLRQSRLFSHLPDPLLNQLTEFSKLVDFPVGSEILKEDHPNQDIFFLIRGRLAVYSKGELILKLERKGDIIGEMSVISEKMTSATVVAESPVRLFSIRAGDIGRFTDINAETLQHTLYRIFAMILVEKLAMTTHKARQYEIVNRRLQHRVGLETLISAVSSLFIDLGVKNIREMIQQAVHLIGEFFQAQKCFLLLDALADNEKRLVFGSSDGKDDETWLRSVEKSADTVFRQIRTQMQANASMDSDYIELPLEVIDSRSSADPSVRLFCVPLTRQDRLTGMFGFILSHSGVPFQKEDRGLLGVVGEIILNIMDRKLVATKLHQAYLAGMAENAISVLHNIGNAVTPVVVSIHDLLKGDRMPTVSDYLVKIRQTLFDRLQDGELGPYLLTDQKGRELLPFFGKLIDELRTGTSRQRQQLEAADRQLQQILELISLQQKYARFLSPEEPFHLETLIHDVLEMMGPLLSRNRVSIIRKIESDLPALSIDKNKLVQVLINVLKNAVESIEEQMQKTSTSDSSIEIRAERLNEAIAVSIRDTGVGMGPEDTYRVFEFGFSTKKHSTGFGLHDCAGFIQLNGGEIRLESDGIGKGATLTFTLPIAPDERK